MQDLIKNHPVKFQLGGFLVLILFIIGTTVSFRDDRNEINNHFTTMTNQYDHCLKWYQTLDDNQKSILAKNYEQDIIITEMSGNIKMILDGIADIKKTLGK